MTQLQLVTQLVTQRLVTQLRRATDPQPSFLEYNQNLAQKQVGRFLFTIDPLRSDLLFLVNLAGRV